MDAVQQAIQSFTFYSLSQCTHQQLLSHSKHPVNIYHRKQSNQIFVVKQIPYQENLVRIYRILNDVQTLNVVSVVGLGRYRLGRGGWNQERNNNHNSRRVDREKIVGCGDGESYYDWNNNSRSSRDAYTRIRDNSYLRIWMPKYEKNLADYVDERRKKLAPFSAHEIKNLMFQILTTLRILQKKGICHRDIKPQNILINHGRYFLCDFDQAIITRWGNQQKSPSQIMSDLQYTTILYSTPKFLKSIKQNNLRQKYFDPYKMDVYSFGLTLLYVCSLGKFAIDQRHLYMYGQSNTHEEFIQEERRKFVKRDPQLKVFNNILKLMLEQDQYKRDDFQSLNEKIIDLLGIDNQSEQSFSTKSAKQRRKDRQKVRKSHGKGFTCGKLKPSEKFLISVFITTFLIYFFLIIF